MKYLKPFNESKDEHEEKIADIKDVFQDVIDEYNLEKHILSGLGTNNGITYFYNYTPEYYDSKKRKCHDFEIFICVQYTQLSILNSNGVDVLRSNQKIYKQFKDMHDKGLVNFYQRIKQMGFKVRLIPTHVAEGNNNPLKISIKLE